MPWDLGGGRSGAAPFSLLSHHSVQKKCDYVLTTSVTVTTNIERCSPLHENMDKMRVRRKDANQPSPCVPTSPSLTPPDSRIKNLKYVIFPDNRWIQVWDLFMIFAIWNYAFSIPFSFGISRGYYSATSQGYWIYRVIINIGFFGEIARIPSTMVSFEHVSFKQKTFNQVLFHFSPNKLRYS